MRKTDIDRHARHILLKEIGGPGQARLGAARVVMIGAGGLGAPAALYLAAAGIGELVIIDPDTVSLDNLQRQVLFRTADIGRQKVDAARDALAALDPAVRIEPVHGRADPASLPGLLAGADLVLDGCDDFATRFAVNAAAIAARIALVSGAVGRWDGQVSTFAPHLGSHAPCYRCLVPDIPPDAESCAVTGIVGAITGIAGTLMALEAIKLITGAGEPLIGRVQIVDGLSGALRTVKLARDPSCPACGGG
ncbi:MAG: Molybdopterin biosynthesis protein MoeB [Oceanicaulis sp. HLUCCA04]|nr:MAG: Molybdopterin biosynthesis protein MoeB [Oceanicaulis sp. HLUCCA04]